MSGLGPAGRVGVCRRAGSRWCATTWPSRSQVLASRMVRDYVNQRFSTRRPPAARLMLADTYAAAKDLAAWRAMLATKWAHVRVGHVETIGQRENPEAGNVLGVRASINPPVPRSATSRCRSSTAAQTTHDELHDIRASRRSRGLVSARTGCTGSRDPCPWAVPVSLSLLGTGLARRIRRSSGAPASVWSSTPEPGARRRCRSRPSSSDSTSLIEKAFPSGSRKANIGGTPGQRSISLVSTPAQIQCCVRGLRVVGREADANCPREISGVAGSSVTMTLLRPGQFDLDRRPVDRTCPGRQQRHRHAGAGHAGDLARSDWHPLHDRRRANRAHGAVCRGRRHRRDTALAGCAADVRLPRPRRERLLDERGRIAAR